MEKLTLIMNELKRKGFKIEFSRSAVLKTDKADYQILQDGFNSNTLKVIRILGYGYAPKIIAMHNLEKTTVTSLLNSVNKDIALLN